MKKLIMIIAFTALFYSCDKDDSPDCQGIDCLPPITQTGAGTFGCLINGEPFVDNSDEFNCFYQLIDGEYFFGISARSSVQNVRRMRIASEKKEIILGRIIPLNGLEPNQFYTELNFEGINPNGITTSMEDGFVLFTEFNTNSNVVSATFEFTVTDPNTGIVYNITEGRFDSQFTQ